MKKTWIALCLVLALVLSLSPLCFAAGDNYDTLADWNIRIAVPDGATAVLEENEYYLYTQKTGSLPYVMLTTYRYSSVEKFLVDFTAYMQTRYADLDVTAEAEEKSFGDKTGWEIDYGYTISGNAVRDRRVVLWVDGVVYLFASKEVEALGMTVGTMLDDVVADCEFLGAVGAEPAGAEERSFASAYLFRLENGMPKYWLDFTGAILDVPVLHCYFRSGDPTFYESLYFLDLDTADLSDDRIVFHQVRDQYGIDCSQFFTTLQLDREGDALVLSVERDPSTLAGGTEDNLLDGSYRMSPLSAGLIYVYRQEDGMVKYWLDSDDENIQLHAMFRSGEPEFYEEVFTLDTASAQLEGGYTLSFSKVFHSTGQEVSDWFKSLTLSEVQGAYLMNVQRDESTLAGGEDDNILSGVYLFDPWTYLLPLDGGPYTADELGEWAQIFYFRHNGFFPPAADVEQNADGSFSIHLYEVVQLDGVSHTATSAWYTVDAYGTGVDDISGSPVDLFS